MADVPFTLALISGGIAGTTVDCALHPLDTFRTRLQSEKGFWASGGFRGAYKGILSAAMGSAPGAAMFFSTYETMKKVMKTMSGDKEMASSKGAVFGPWRGEGKSSKGNTDGCCMVQTSDMLVNNSRG
eukprot:symbB.v1.2.015370.t1/scaffold1146.1/size135487/2